MTCRLRLGRSLAALACLGLLAGAAGRVSAATLTTLYNFHGTTDGGFPASGLVMDSAGNLYGTGTYDLYFSATPVLATVFELHRPTGSGAPWTQTVLQNFPDGSNLPTGLVVNRNGRLFGMTTNPGDGGTDGVFKLVPDPIGSAWTMRVLARFAEGTVWPWPQTNGPVTLRPSGALFATTSQGGTYTQGTLFKLTPPEVPGGPWSEATLWSFGAEGDGANPSGALVFDAAGTAYGTTQYGGTVGSGTVFALARPTAGRAHWTESVLYSFQDGSDGFEPGTGVILDPHGKLLGTTSGGGVPAACADCMAAGTVFLLQRPPAADAPWTKSIVWSFTGTDDGGSPSGLVMDRAGNLYGTTFGGGLPDGTGSGTVFKLTPYAFGPTPWVLTTLHTFSGTDGGGPTGGVVIDAAGNLYGTTSSGGQYGAGTVFELTP
jgi:uncharacterized repeat protein (TIGR03803 family)